MGMGVGDEMGWVRDEMGWGGFGRGGMKWCGVGVRGGVGDEWGLGCGVMMGWGRVGWCSWYSSTHTSVVGSRSSEISIQYSVFRIRSSVFSLHDSQLTTH